MSNIALLITLCITNLGLSSCADISPVTSHPGPTVSTTMTSLQLHATDDSDCPVRHNEPAGNVTTNSRHSQGGSCTCNTPLREINCLGLSDIPRFVDHPRRVPPATWNTVHMSHQTISELHPAAFGRLRTTRLVLNYNPIGDHISARALAGLETVLSELQLGSCRIHNLPSGLLAGMNRLERLHLWGNRIQRLPIGFFRQARNLRELLLWENEIKVLDADTLAGLWNLRRLDLDRNHITNLNKDAFRHLSELESLHLANNQILKLLDEPFIYMTNLRALSLAGNQIAYIHPRAFDGLGQLLSLALNNNNISLLPDGLFQQLGNLTQLLLHNNAVDFVWPMTFAGLRALDRLQLAGNRISKLHDGALRHSPALRHLDLDGNQLETLGRCSLPPPSRLATLSAPSSRSSPAASGGGRAHAQSSNAAPGSVRSSPSLRYLSLVGNPIICDCQLAWIMDFEEQTSTKKDNLDWSMWPTVRGTCRDIRPTTATHGSRLHSSSSSAAATHSSSHPAGSSIGRPSSSSSLDAESHHHHHHHLVEHRVSSIVGRCSQLAASCDKDSFKTSKDCHYE